MTTQRKGARAQIRSYIEENYLYMRPDLELADDQDLLATGVIDSLGFLELVEEIQEQYSITVVDAEITEQNFGSIDAMVGFIEGKQRG